MKQLIILLSLFLAFLECRSQEISKKYEFPKFTWSINVPVEFTISENLPSAGILITGEQSIKIEKDKSNALYCDIFTVDSVWLSIWQNSFKPRNKERFAFFESTIPKKIDSFTTKEIIDGINFEKFHVISISYLNKKKGVFYYTTIYEGYVVGFYINFDDESIAKRFDKIVTESKFGKGK